MERDFKQPNNTLTGQFALPVQIVPSKNIDSDDDNEGASEEDSEEDFSEMSVKELKAKCEKKGLDFETEKAKLDQKRSGKKG